MNAAVKDSIKNEIKRLCYKKTLNIPRISYMKVKGVTLVDGTYLYEYATCIIKDVYTCPFTSEKRTDVYHVTYDGIEVQMEQQH